MELFMRLDRVAYTVGNMLSCELSLDSPHIFRSRCHARGLRQYYSLDGAVRIWYDL